MSKLALVGAGNMGFALLSRWVVALGHEVIVIEPNDDLRARALGLGVEAYASPDELPFGYRIDILVIATKPQTVGDVAARYGALLSTEALIISVAAGVCLDEISNRVGRSVAVIRAMPNTPASIGEGMIVCCPNELARLPDFVLTTERLLSTVGRVAFVDDEGLMDTVTAVSGSGPAYVFYFIEALAAAGTSAGLNAELALVLAKQTVFGAAKLALDSEMAPSALREQVTSPNGTTAAALSVLMAEDGGLASRVSVAVEAARKRSIELGALSRSRRAD
ncbi:pyrroline-5-carboxylate reductase [Shinella sp. S4-D37]|uniref:pyrroline-5-carboxylate reductase n=1 Tax=Shinella sp. S4-D37 TaxID=3161999 RepID=UPI0034656EAF